MIPTFLPRHLLIAVALASGTLLLGACVTPDKVTTTTTEQSTTVQPPPVSTSTTTTTIQKTPQP
jgi:uncharacterized lipoprotein YajG